MKREEKILVVDDDRAVLDSINDILTVREYSVDLAKSGEEAIDKIKQARYDLVITDLMMRGISGLDLLKEIKRISPGTVVIVITGHATVNTAIEAIKLGAHDYLSKPFSDEEIVLRIDRGLQDKRNEVERNLLRRQIEEKYSFNNIISKDPKMLAIFDQILEIAETDATVLIFGDTGTGKELIAKSIHYHSHRKDAPFVAIHCAALTETLLESELFGHEKGAFTGAFKQKKGRFEQAHGGSIFLDEVGDIPLVTQVKLLRVLQEREFERVGGTETLKTDIRIIAATNKNLEKLIKDGLFREDFYYRLNVFPIKLPPLRNRKEDLPLLVEHFIKQLNHRLNKDIEKVSGSVLDNFFNYHWPGNIRELENVLERAVLVNKGKVIERAELGPSALREEVKGMEEIEEYKEFKKKVLDPMEKEYLIKMLGKYNGDINNIISKMGVSKRTFYNRAKDYGISLR